MSKMKLALDLMLAPLEHTLWYLEDRPGRSPLWWRYADRVHGWRWRWDDSVGRWVNRATSKVL